MTKLSLSHLFNEQIERLSAPAAESARSAIEGMSAMAGAVPRRYGLDFKSIKIQVCVRRQAAPACKIASKSGKAKTIAQKIIWAAARRFLGILNRAP